MGVLVMPQCCTAPCRSEQKGMHKFPKDKTVSKPWLVAIRRVIFALGCMITYSNSIWDGKYEVIMVIRYLRH